MILFNYIIYFCGAKRIKQMKIIRYKYNTYNVIDRVYNDDSLLFEQTNLNSKNRFGAKKFKCNNGTTLAVNSWEWGNIKE